MQRALPEIDLDEVYGNEAGGVAKFTSILTQYGTGFALAQKIAKKVVGKAVSTKLAQKTAKNLAKTKAGEAGEDLALVFGKVRAFECPFIWEFVRVCHDVYVWLLLCDLDLNDAFDSVSLMSWTVLNFTDTVSFGFSSVYSLLPEPFGFLPVPFFGSLILVFLHCL